MTVMRILRKCGGPSRRSKGRASTSSGPSATGRRQASTPSCSSTISARTTPRNTFPNSPAKKGHTVFAYVIEGSACFDESRDPHARETLVHYGDGDTVSITAEEIRIAFDEYRKGTFIKHR